MSGHGGTRNSTPPGRFVGGLVPPNTPTDPAAKLLNQQAEAARQQTTAPSFSQSQDLIARGVLEPGDTSVTLPVASESTPMVRVPPNLRSGTRIMPRVATTAQPGAEQFGPAAPTDEEVQFDKAAAEKNAIEARAKAVIAADKPLTMPFSKLVDSWIDPNPLNALFNPTYHFRLFMTREIDPIRGASSLDQMRRNLELLEQRIIAESGVTGYTIKDVEFETVVSMNALTHDQKATQWTITVIEPRGVSFIDSMFGAAKTLGVWDWTKMVYYIELTFKGYGEDGKFVDNPLTKMPGNGKWTWALTPVDIETKLTEGTATYTMHFVTHESQSVMMDASAITADQNLTVHGSTLQEMFDDYARQLTDFNRKQFGENKTGQLITYKINAQHPVIVGPDRTAVPGTFTLSIPKPNEQNTRCFTLQDEHTANVQAGKSVQDFITDAINATNQGQKLMNLPEGNDAPAAKDKDGKPVAGAPKAKQSATIFSIEPDIEVTGVDTVSGNYEKTVTLHVVPFFTQTPILSPEQRAEAKTDPAIQRMIIGNLGRYGMIKRRYDYIFTGNNSEVIDFNLDFNMSWQAALPKFGGARLDYQSVAVQAQYTPAADARQNPHPQPPEADEHTRSLVGQHTVPPATAQGGAASSAADMTRSSGTAATSGTTTPATQAGSGGTRPAQGGGIVSSVRQGLNDFKSLFAARTPNVLHDNAKKAINAAVGTVINIEKLGVIDYAATEGSGKRTYMEDIITRVNQGQRVGSDILPVSFTNHYQTPGKFAAPGMPGSRDSDNSMVGALFAQMYGAPIVNNFATINMTIRGDPYWLGQSNLQRQIVLRNMQPTYDGNALPDYGSMRPGIFVFFRYPSQTGDDFSPLLNDSLVFNGVYEVVHVKHSFTDGQFKQVLSAQIMPLVDVQLAYQNDPGKDPEPPATPPPPSPTTNADGTPANPAATPSNAAPSANGNTPGSETNAQVAATGTLPQSQTAQQAAKESYKFWLGKGYSPAAAAGMVATEEAESGFKPHSVGDSGAAQGSFQWHPDRQRAIKAATGIDVTSPSTTHEQMLEAAYWEQTKGSEKAAGAAIRSATTGAAAASTATIKFERPANTLATAQARAGRGAFWANNFASET